MLGSMIPLPATKSQADAGNDTRPFLEELYGDHAGYVTRVTETAKQLQERRLLLPEDVKRISEEAQASDVLE